MVRWSALLLGLVVVGGWAAWQWARMSVPQVYDFDSYRAQAAQLSRVYAADGTVIAEFADERRTVVSLEQISGHVVAAVLAAEDADFFQHEGLDYLGIARALYRDVIEWRFAQGGSTITQQVAKTLFVGTERTIGRKWREAVVAFELERRLSKADILAIYLNAIYFGHGRYGVEEASRFYFGTAASELGPAEAAVLAGLIRSPENLSPFRDPEACRVRRDTVLHAMQSGKKLSGTELAAAVGSGLPTEPHGFRPKPEWAYYVDAVRREVLQHVGVAGLRREGLQIRTAMNPAWQRAARDAVASGLRQADRRVTSWPRRVVARKGDLPRDADGSGPHRSARVEGRDSRRAGYWVRVGGRRRWMPDSTLKRYDEADNDGSKLSTGMWLPVSLGPPASVGGGLSVNPEIGPQAALVVSDPHTGWIRAVVGGDDAARRPYNRAVQARRQMGSTVKPLLIAAGLEHGTLQTRDTVSADPISLPNGRGGRWRPSSTSKVSGRIELEQVLIHSVNSSAVRVLLGLGLDAASEFLSRVGLRSDGRAGLALALGAVEATPLSVLGAISIFPAGGVYREPMTLVSIRTPTGATLVDNETDGGGRRVIEPAHAQWVGSALRRAVDEGTGRGARLDGVAAAGKTGTTDRGVDNWFVGWTPDFCAVAWVGFDEPTAIPGGAGGRLAAPMWRGFAERIRRSTASGPARPHNELARGRVAE